MQTQTWEASFALPKRTLRGKVLFVLLYFFSSMVGRKGISTLNVLVKNMPTNN